jgi:hypothetical protein
MVAATLTPAEVDRWPLLTSGLSPRVARHATRAGLQTVGELRGQLTANQRLPGLGRKGCRQANEFFSRAAAPLPATMREWLTALLTPTELAVVELRYGLTDRLWRPTMRLCTFREVAATRGIAPARAGQICKGARLKLRSRLGRALSRVIVAECPPRLPATELRTWRGQSWLGGYEPWGALALLDEVTA